MEQSWRFSKPSARAWSTPARDDGVSYAPPERTRGAARVARELALRYIERPIQRAVLLNVNVPDVPYDELKGIEVTRLGRRHKAQPVVAGKNPRGETVYWVGPAGAARAHHVPL